MKVLLVSLLIGFSGVSLAAPAKKHHDKMMKCEMKDNKCMCMHGKKMKAMDMKHCEHMKDMPAPASTEPSPAAAPEAPAPAAN